MIAVRDFILIAVKVKQCSERSQIFHVSNSELKQRSECSQRFPFNSSEVKQRCECSQWIKTA